MRKEFAGHGQRNAKIGEEVDQRTGRQRDVERLEPEQNMETQANILNPVDRGPVTLRFIARGSPSGDAGFISFGTS